MMPVQRLLRGLFFAVTFLIVFVSQATVFAQNPSQPNSTDWHFRYELFQMLLEQNGLKPADPQIVLDRPTESVIVKIGEPRSFPPPQYLETYCRNGGRVLMATDTSYSAGRLGEFHAAPVEAVEVVDRYQNFRDCIKITNLNNSHPLMEGVGNIVVNRSGWLTADRRTQSEWNVAATLPRNCKPQLSSRQPVLMSMDDWGSNDGRLILSADPSIFTNGMLWHGDNAILAINISRILAEKNRKYLMFIVDDVAQDTYANSPHVNNAEQQRPPLPENLPDNLPEPELDTMLRIMNSVVKNVEESNVFNEALANRPRNLRTPYYWRWVMFILAFLAIMFVIWKLTSNGPTSHPTMPPRNMKSAHELAADQKTKSLELGLSASILARELCRELTDSTDPAIWQRTLSANPASGDSLFQEKSTQQRLAPLLSLAVNTRTVHISRKRFESLGQTIIELRKLHKEGLLLKHDLQAISS